MPRQPRIDVPGIPQHIVQRGNDRQPTFFADADRVRYLTELNEITLRVVCHVHAYVLMTNHVHLLVTPTEPGQISHVMQSLGRRYVRHINDRYHRTGTLWEGRYKACPIQGSTHLLRCYRYIELNPVRAAMVADPCGYPWSSHHANAFGQQDPLVHPHAEYLALSPEPVQRLAAYRTVVMEPIDPLELDAIRHHLQRQHAYGSDRFRYAIEAKLGRRAGPAKIDPAAQARPPRFFRKFTLTPLSVDPAFGQGAIPDDIDAALHREPNERIDALLGSYTVRSTDPAARFTPPILLSAVTTSSNLPYVFFTNWLSRRPSRYF